MLKGKTYHDLLRHFVETIGCTECPARKEEASACCGDMGEEDEVRTVGRVVERNGAWEIHLITVDKRCPCRFRQNRLRTFRTRKMAEIVARYTAAARTDGNAPDNGEPLPFCWN